MASKSSAISSSSTSTSLNKSVNGSLQASNRSRASVVKRSVTPNSRAQYSNISAAEADAKPKHRSVTPVSRNHGDGEPPVVVAKLAPAGSKRSLAPFSRSDSVVAHDPEPGRVRVAVRLRPRNAEDLASDSDYVDCVEPQPELKKLKLRKNNWSSESYRFDEVLTETASQKRVYQAVAKPVVESVLSGYNGTVMAYGQTGTGKTHTVGNLGKNDASDRGIMVRAVEDIIANTSPGYDTVEFSYMQLYMESVQDLLSPEKVNIPIVEDPKTGEVSLPGAEVVHIQDLDQFMDLLQRGDANRHAANTKMNTNSSRSHAILMVYVKRSVDGKPNTENGDFGLSTVRKSKLLIVDLAGSERIDKSGSEGHLLEEAKFINLSLTSLGKCINALAENSPHIPTRESKLTRLLRDSFGGSARTSLIITIGPSSRHHAETTSTIMFGQRAMKIVNMVKLKEEFDYESFSRKLESQVDCLTKEVDRQQKLRENQVNEMQKKLKECQQSYNEAEKDLIARSEILEKENSRLESELEIVRNDLNAQKDCNKVLGDKVVRLEMRLEHFKGEEEVKSNEWRTQLEEMRQMGKAEIFELNKRLEQKDLSHEVTMKELESLRAKYMNLSLEKDKLAGEVENLRDKLMTEEKQKVTIESELLKFKKPAQESNADVEEKKLYVKQLTNRGSSSFRSTMGLPRSISGQRMNLAQLCEEVGLEKILSMLSSDDIDHQMYAVKVVANLAAEDVNQEKIVNDGGLDALLMILRTSQNTTILRVASGAIANLAMNEINQGLIMSKGGAQLLATTASKTDDPQTLRMVAGAIANLCGNAKLHMILKDNGCINALLGMSKSNNADVVAQVSRGLANFAKCETREVIQGHRKGPSLLTDEGALTWLIENSKDSTSDPSQRHIELALCHLAQNDDNTHDIISCGGLKEVKRISQKSAREDIRNLATKTLKSNPTFQAQLRVGESTNTL